MGRHDGRIDHRVFVIESLARYLKTRSQTPAFAPAGKARMNHLPVSEALRQVPPRHAGPISAQNRLNEQTIVRVSTVLLKLGALAGAPKRPSSYNVVRSARA
jgi:hypothetical protein